MMLNRCFVLLIVFFALAEIGGAQDSRRAATIAALRAQWAANLHQKKLDDFVEMYAPNATFVGGGKRFTGQPAIRELTKNLMASFTSDIELRSINTEFCGDLVYDSGDYRETLTKISDGSKTSIHGDYLTIYKRSANRKWLIVQQMWTEASTASHHAGKADMSRSNETRSGGRRLLRLYAVNSG